jgi:hypothetical protein
MEWVRSRETSPAISNNIRGFEKTSRSGLFCIKIKSQKKPPLEALAELAESNLSKGGFVFNLL